MIFVELVLENFGSYRDRQTIVLDPRMNGETGPIVLLGAMNGGGKTTLMDAIRLALYGHRAHCSTRWEGLSYGDFLSQCVNVHTTPPNKTRIELVFECVENDKPALYRIVRTWEVNPKNGKDSLTVFEVASGGEVGWIKSELVATWDDWIENLFPLGISNLFLFDGEQIKELAEEDTPPPIVVEAIKGLLGLELAERLGIDLETLASRKRKELASNRALANLDSIEQKISTQQQELEARSQASAILESQLQICEQEQQEAFDRFVREGGKIAGNRSLVDAQIRIKTAETDKLRQKMRDLAFDVLPLNLIEPLLNRVKMQVKNEAKLRQIANAQNVLVEYDRRLVSWVEQSEVLPNWIEDFKTFISQDVAKVSQDCCKNLWLEADDDSASKMREVIERAKRLQAIAGQHLKSLQMEEEELLALERQTQTAASPEDYENLVDALKAAQENLAKTKARATIAGQEAKELENAIASSKKELRDYVEASVSREGDKHVLSVFAKIKLTLDQFCQRLTAKKIGKLETEVTSCFRFLLHKTDLVQRVAIASDTFELSLYGMQGESIPKHRLSAGEKQLLAIAFLWGLARTSGRRLPVAIDTPLGRLDSSHRDNLIERYFPHASHQVILLSTNTEIGEKEVNKLREKNAIAREYLLGYKARDRQTLVKAGYFW